MADRPGLTTKSGAGTPPTEAATPSSVAAGRPGGVSFRQWLGSSGQWSNLAIKVTSILVLLGIWQVLSVVQGALLMPGPIAVAQRLVDVVLYEDFVFHMRKTVVRVLGGLGISMVLAVLVGIPMGLSRPIERFLEPYVLLGLTIPGLAWALIAIMIVGITDWAPITAIVVTTSPMVILNMWHGTKSIDMQVMEMGRAFHADRRLLLRHVVLPQLLPFVLAGTRLGLALAWKIVVLSELFGLSNGVGYQINVNFSAFSLSGVMAWTIAFTFVMAFIEFTFLRPIERRVTRWRPDVQGA